MTTKHTKIVISLSLAIALVIPFFFLSYPQKKFRYKIFKKDNGWGYEVLVNKKLFIHQEYIPTLAGENIFSERSQAEKTAMLIINKIERGQLPVVTKFEIRQILSETTP